MYGCLKDKKKVLVKKRAAKVDMSDTGVTVTTADGDTFSGDIVVGADGVHSMVREAMWRYAGEQTAEKNKGWFQRSTHTSSTNSSLSSPGAMTPLTIAA